MPQPEPLRPNPGTYRHADGGVYLFGGVARSSANREKLLVIYTHVWPFERELWARPIEEWASRFTLMSDAEYLEVTKGDRAEAQAVITAKRSARKGLSKA